MALEELTVLLPCHSLEDISLDRPDDEADDLLAAWSALFHPSLIHAAQCVPSWAKASAPPEEIENRLILIPPCCNGELPEGWLQKAEEAGARLVHDIRGRSNMVAALLDKLDDPKPTVEDRWANDFLALGFCHFLVELLTRQLRYMSNLDEVQFQRVAITAAEGAIEGNEQMAEDNLQSAFDLLTESREYFYPVDTHFIDLTLVAPTTLGASMRAELAGDWTTNLLLTGQQVERMAQREPDSVRALTAALEEGTASLAGGEFTEPELAMMPPEAILSEIGRGLTAYDRHLGQRPLYFGRRRFGLCPVLPQILKQSGFQGAIHFTLDDGRFPKGKQSKIRWQGLGPTQLESLARLPINVARSSSFLSFPEKLGDTMDLDHASTVVFAHWPGESSPWYDDLRRMDKYSPVLGRFISLSEYYKKTEYTGQATHYTADQYRPPYFQQAIASERSDPISRFVDYFRRRATFEASRTLRAMAVLASGRQTGVPNAEDVEARIGGALESQIDAGASAALDAVLNRQFNDAMERLVEALPGKSADAEKGHWVANPWSFSQRLAADPADAQSRATVEVPAMGFAWIGPKPPTPTESSEARKPQKKSRWGKQTEEPPMAEENQLRNDIFEVTIDPITGVMKSLFDFTTRGNRLAQQVVLRRPTSTSAQRDDPEAAYSVMAVDQMDVTSPGPIVGEIVCRGRLLDRTGKRVADYVQTFRATRGNPILELELQLEPLRRPDPNPWDSYYAMRFAWGDATADIVRSVNLVGVATERDLIESPHFVDIRSEGERRVTLLTGGLPYHRRFGLRKLDTLLVTTGEAARSFRLGIGVNLPYPVSAALGFMSPVARLAVDACPTLRSGWLFHVDAKNIVATHWEPILAEGRVVGFVARLIETEGRPVQARLRSFRSVASAVKVNFVGEDSTDLSVQDDRITLDVAAHEWLQIEARFDQ